MSVLPARRVVAGLIVLAAIAVMAASATAALDLKPPTKPGNLHTTAKTMTSVSMAWNASTDNSGDFSYRVHLWGDPTVVPLPKTQTSYTWTGLRPGVQYYFWVEAVDRSGNTSTSDLLVVETVRDTTPPAPPGNLEVETTTASQVSLSWDASTDDSGIIDLYQVTVSPAPAGNVVFTGATSATVVGLAPTTTYTFTVRARDAGWNFSQPSNAVSATTEASTDTTPPSAPVLQIGRSNSCEVVVRWTQSTDNQDPQAGIRYELFDNGIRDPSFGFVIGTGRQTTYGFEGTNTWVLYAIDSAGNRSAPSNPVTRDLAGDDCQ
jgi:chitodextrinase